jgi:hypothetical protein
LEGLASLVCLLLGYAKISHFPFKTNVVGACWAPLALILATAAIMAEAASGHSASSVLPAVAMPSLAIDLSAVGVWI